MVGGDPSRHAPRARVQAGKACRPPGLRATVILEPLEAAIRRAQAMVGRYAPPGLGLADELNRRTPTRPLAPPLV